MKFIDLDGQRFGRLTVIRRNGISKDRYIKWLCQCECGQQLTVKSSSLKSGHTKSCGCLQKELVSQRSYKHGHKCRNKPSKTYIVWYNMIQRCNNPDNKHYKNYGGRGIKVYQRWLRFENFLEDMGEQLKGLTLDRIDNNGDYCPENCQWSTRTEQQRNKRTNRLITINGITKCLIGWCEYYGLKYQTVCNRLWRGWTPEEALEIVPRCRKTKEK